MPTTNREQDANGFLLVKACPITSFGIFDYGAGQLGLPGDPNRIVKVFRPESAVNDPAAIESFKNVPLINDHEMLSGFQNDKGATAPEDYGVSGVLTGNVYYDAPWMRGDLKVFSREMQAALASGKKDLSLGYSCDFHAKPGVWQGQPYEVVQDNMRGNHIALVDEGRVPGARVLDGLVFDHLNFAVRPSTDTEESEMVRKGKAFDNAVQQLKALLPALEQFLNQEGQEPEHQDAGATGGMGGAAGSESEGGAAVATPVSGAEETDKGGAVAVKPEAGTPVTVEHPEGGEAGGAEGAGGEGGAEGGEAAGGEAGGGENVEALISEVEAVLAKIKAAMGGGQVGDEGDNDGEGTTDSTQGLQEVNQGEGGAVCADGDEAGGKGAGATEGQGKASPGPSAGVHAEAGDSALQRFYGDLAVKTGLYDRLSPIVGAFDHKAMDARAVAVYGLKKLGLKAAKGAEVVALDSYLTGRAAAKQATQQRIQKTAADSAAVVDEMDAYLNGAK